MTNVDGKVQFPNIETDRLILREISLADADTLHQYWSHRDVTEYLTMEPFREIGETRQMIMLLRSLFEQEQGIRWAITNKKDSMVLGTCGFHNLKPEHSRAEIGYELGRDYWGKKIMTEALTAIINYGFKCFNYNRIEAFVNFGNIKSTGILEKIGFHCDGLLREYEFARGKFVDQYCYSLLKTEFTSLTKRVK